MTRKEINDLLLSIHNRCHWLRDSEYECEKWHRLAPMLIEDIFVDAQELLDSYCVVRPRETYAEVERRILAYGASRPQSTPP